MINYNNINKIFFTSDTHFGQESKLKRRPYKTVKEMDEAMINNWNEIVGENDLVIHCGDFGDYSVRDKLNGKILLICGNYEMNDINLKRINLQQLFNLYHFDDVRKDYKRSQIIIINNKIKIRASHEPSILKKGIERDKSKDNYKTYNIFGHIHDLQKVNYFAVNVGVDCNVWKPMSLDELDHYTKLIERLYKKDIF